MVSNWLHEQEIMCLAFSATPDLTPHLHLHAITTAGKADKSPTLPRQPILNGDIYHTVPAPSAVPVSSMTQPLKTPTEE